MKSNHDCGAFIIKIITIIIRQSFLQFFNVVKEGHLNEYYNNIQLRFLAAYNETFMYVAKPGISMHNSGSTSRVSNELDDYFLT